SGMSVAMPRAPSWAGWWVCGCCVRQDVFHPGESAVEAANELAGHLPEASLDVRVIEVPRVTIEKYALRRTVGGIDEHRREHDRVRELELLDFCGELQCVVKNTTIDHRHARSAEQGRPRGEKPLPGGLIGAQDEVGCVPKSWGVRGDRCRAFQLRGLGMELEL